MDSAIEKGSLCHFALVEREGKNTGGKIFRQYLKRKKRKLDGPSMIPSLTVLKIKDRSFEKSKNKRS